MRKIKERPKCRKVIEEELKKGNFLEEIAIDRMGYYSVGIRTQARKMLLENGKKYLRGRKKEFKSLTIKSLTGGENYAEKKMGNCSKQS